MLQYTEGGGDVKKISQGKYELFTKKEDAIDKFMQMQGVCREEISGQHAIEFYCSDNGKISITNPPKRYIQNTNSTNLFAELIEQDGKTYLTYYTTFSRSNTVLKMITLVISIIVIVLAIIFAIMNEDKTTNLIILPLGLVLFAAQFFDSTKEGKNSTKDSEILVKELERRVEAVNLWDK